MTCPGRFSLVRDSDCTRLLQECRNQGRCEQPLITVQPFFEDSGLVALHSQRRRAAPTASTFPSCSSSCRAEVQVCNLDDAHAPAAELFEDGECEMVWPMSESDCATVPPS
jgi:hypothetical protein